MSAKGRIVQLSVSPGGVPKRAVDVARVTTEGIEGDLHTYIHHGGQLGDAVDQLGDVPERFRRLVHVHRQQHDAAEVANLERVFAVAGKVDDDRGAEPVFSRPAPDEEPDLARGLVRGGRPAGELA